MKKIDAMLLRMIRQSRGQFAAVVVIVVVGIAIFTALTMAAVNLESTKDDYYRETGFADLSAGADRIPASVVGRLGGLPGVGRAEGRIAEDVPFIGRDGERVNVKLLSIGGQEQQINQLLFSEGRAIRDDLGEALLYAPFAEARGIGVGDRAEVQINGTRYSLKICGIVQSPEFVYLMENAQAIMPNPEKYGVLYVSRALAQLSLGMAGAYNEVVFLYDEPLTDQREEELIDQVEKRLAAYGFTGTTKAEDQASNSIVTQEIDSLKSVCVALPGLFLLVAGLVMAMMLSRMVKRDRIKIGVLKAMGYGDGQVLMHYVKYSLLVGVLGGIGGILLGMAIAGYMTSIYVTFFSMPSYGMKFYSEFYVAAIFLSCGCCVLAGVLGARECLRIAPAESMQAEAPKAGKRILLEGLPFLWRRISFSRKLIAKNIFRNKKRSVFILAGVSLTYGMMLFTLTMPGVIDEMMVKYFSEFQTMDYNVSFYSPVTRKVVRDLSHELPDAEIEGKIEYPFALSRGNRKDTVMVIGLEENTRFFALTDVKKKPLRPEPGGILLTENLAKKLGVKEGERIRIEGFFPGSRERWLPVAGIVRQSLGMNAYMEIGDMGSRLLEKNGVTGVYINSKDPELVEKLQRADQVATVVSTEEMKNTFGQFIGLTVLCIGCMVFLSGILGFCIVYNATIVSLSEREMEFSSLRVLGFSKDEIFRMILTENAWLSLVGIFLGIPVGRVMAEYSSAVFSTEMYTMHMEPTLQAGVLSLVLTGVFLFLAQLAAHQKINRLDFLQALKNRAS